MPYAVLLTPKMMKGIVTAAKGLANTTIPANNISTATTFGPNATCNRAQVVTFLYRAYK